MRDRENKKIAELFDPDKPDHAALLLPFEITVAVRR